MKSGDIRLCVDYPEFNKKTQKYTHSLPLSDEVQDNLANSSILVPMTYSVDTGS